MQVKRERSWGLGLFGLPFFGVGIGFLLFSVLPTLYDGWRMASWPSSMATLSQAQLTRSTSDGSTTYGVAARYRYQVAGRDYQGERVAINSGSDNIGDFQQQLGSRLEHLYRNNLPVTVYYNPVAPSEALLDRSLRWGLLGFKLIFVVIFGGVGLGLIIIALRGKKVIDTPEAAAKPWLRRVEWADNRIRSNARSGLYAIWGFAIFWNLVSLPALFGVAPVWQKQGAVALLILLFPAVGLLLLSWAVRKSLEWRRFGPTPLRLDPFPGAIGGDVAGEVLLNIPFEPQLVCEVTLSSLYSYISGSGKNRSRHERLEWQESGYARVERAANGVRALFRFAVPAGLHESEEHSSSYYLWRLNIKAELPGVDLDRDFEIPAYATGARAHGISVESAQERPRGVPEPSVESLLPLHREGIGLVLHYPMLRRPLHSLLGVLFGGVFGGVGLFLWGEAQREGGMLYLMSAVFTLVGGGIALAALYSALNALRVELDGHRLSVTRSVLGLPIKRRQVNYLEVWEVQERRGATTQQGNKHRIDYRVVAITTAGELVLAEQLDSQSKAKQVAEFFRKQLKLKGKAKAKAGEAELVIEVE
jgi:hypothetical protein